MAVNLEKQAENPKIEIMSRLDSEVQDDIVKALSFKSMNGTVHEGFHFTPGEIISSLEAALAYQNKMDEPLINSVNDTIENGWVPLYAVDSKNENRQKALKTLMKATKIIGKSIRDGYLMNGTTPEQYKKKIEPIIGTRLLVSYELDIPGERFNS